MSKPLDKALKTHGFALARTKKHRVYKHGDGSTFVLASTTSDVRAEQNAIATFARLVGKRVADLQAPQHPKRSQRPHTKLEPCPQPKPVAPKLEPISPEHLRLEKQLRKLEKRDSKYAAAKARKHTERRKELTHVMEVAVKIQEKSGYKPIQTCVECAHYLRYIGYNDVEPVVITAVGAPFDPAGTILGYVAVRVGGWYIDVTYQRVWETSRWKLHFQDTGEVEEFEAVCALSEVAAARHVTPPAGLSVEAESC